MNVYTKPELQCLAKDYLYKTVRNKPKFVTYRHVLERVRIKAVWLDELTSLLNIDKNHLEENWLVFKNKVEDFLADYSGHVQFSDKALKNLVKNYVFAQYEKDNIIKYTNAILIKYLTKHKHLEWVKQLSQRLQVDLDNEKHLRARLWEWLNETELPICYLCGKNKVSLKTFFELNRLCEECIKKKYANCFKPNKQPTHKFDTSLFQAKPGGYPQELKDFVRELTYINKLGTLVLKPKWRLIAETHKEQFQKLLDATDFIEWDETGKCLSRKIYCILHDMTEEPKCAYSKCNNVCTFKGLDHGYGKFCGAGKGCNTKHEIEDLGITPKMNSKEAIERRNETRKQTFLERYGVDNPLKIPEVRQKVSEKLKKVVG